MGLRGNVRAIHIDEAVNETEARWKGARTQDEFSAKGKGELFFERGFELEAEP